jgi:hypothetical protein
MFSGWGKQPLAYPWQGEAGGGGRREQAYMKFDMMNSPSML